jgi:hypothetical protein
MKKQIPKNLSVWDCRLDLYGLCHPHVSCQGSEQRTNSAGRLHCRESSLAAEIWSGVWTDLGQTGPGRRVGGWRLYSWGFRVLLAGALSQRPAPLISSHRPCLGATVTLAIRLCWMNSSSSRHLSVT